MNMNMKNIKSLFEISGDLLAIEDLLSENDGDVSDAEGALLEKWFDEIGEELDYKLDNYCRLIAQISNRAAGRQAEIDRLKALVTVDENAVSRLKQRLKGFLELHETTKIETQLHRISIQKNGGKPELVLPDSWVDDPINAPEEYRKPYFLLDKDKIREELTSTSLTTEFLIRELGCDLKPRGTHLRIK